MLGAGGQRNLATGEVTGDDPLAPFGPRGRDQVAEVDGYTTVADLMVNSRYDPDLDEVAAFEEQVGSHGGLGGPQTHPFLLYPSRLSCPDRAAQMSTWVPTSKTCLRGQVVEAGGAR